MNLEQVKALSDEELNLKVAKLHGWKRVRSEKGWNRKREEWDNIPLLHEWWEDKHGQSGGGNLEPPNYCEDLNALHEVENTCLGVDNIGIYEMHLGKIAGGGFGIGASWGATARQRTEAFVLTMEG